MAHAKALAMTATGVALTAVLSTSLASQPVGEIKRVEGSAMISQGAQYVAAREGMQLHELDRILVLEDSSALLQFADGCTHNMSAQELLTVGPRSTCATPEPVGVQDIEPVGAQDIERTAVSQLEAGAGGATFAGSTTAGLIPLGIGAAGGFGWALSEGVGSDDRDPVSPQ
ncbi:MAG: hypothetical protein K9L70_12610 [Thiohalocapsa sp.]|nr:hypothetical protein [Thiohalocapsa sp.]MCF7992553.1 hypothetical protein [Thiohalocapsa sp.]